MQFALQCIYTNYFVRIFALHPHYFRARTMLTLTMPRPKSTETMVALNARVPLALRERATVAAALLDSDMSKEVRKMLKELIARAEAIHGPIVLPSAS